ncbi:MAG: CDP-diacylglycerol--serine O-phosphatidyltransferase [Prevotellaceae bacterium]|nr:CDP-diacylglycerol--serine O-phosphatidyltransferase [Prevotellaceae bacterium]
MKKNIPNAITCCNLLSGCVSVTMAFEGDMEMAFLFIIIGSLFDFCDGMVARLLHVGSSIGKELDSLADCVTFGVAPSTMVYGTLQMLTENELLPYVAFLMAAFSALRLAKFNLDERQTTSFIGLPTPSNALFWASLVVGFSDEIIASRSFALFMICILVLVSCYLLIAEIPMFSLKFKHYGWKGNEVKYILLATSVVLIAIFFEKSLAIVIAWYVVLAIISNVISKK